MEPEEYIQYGRQMIVPEVGLVGQKKIKAARVLVVGAGGLGSPAIAYLAGAGIGKLGIIDPDVVEISNLHRQVIHRLDSVGTPKCESAATFVRNLNPRVSVETYFDAISVANGLDIAAQYDLILDCTDRPATRYLINDIAVVLDKPLVSASALKTEGQLAVYHFRDGPCYRCMFPRPPPPDSVSACSDAGILGPVVGIMGVYQAIESLKVIINTDEAFTPTLTMFSAWGTPPWKTIRIRKRKADCAVCGENPSITKDTFADRELNYDEWCGAALVEPIDPELRLDPADFKKRFSDVTIIDVRPSIQFDLASLPGSRNIPLTKVRKAQSLETLALSPGDATVVVCRFGNDSQLALAALKKLGMRSIHDLKGGLAGWSDSVDPAFPKY